MRARNDKSMGAGWRTVDVIHAVPLVSPLLSSVNSLKPSLGFQPHKTSHSIFTQFSRIRDYNAHFTSSLVGQLHIQQWPLKKKNHWLHFNGYTCEFMKMSKLN